MVYGTIKIATSAVLNQKSMSPGLYGIVCFVVWSLGTAYFSKSPKIWDIIHVFSSTSYMSKFVQIPNRKYEQPWFEQTN